MNEREWDLPKTETIAWFFGVSPHPPAWGFGKFNMNSLPVRLGAWWEGTCGFVPQKHYFSGSLK